MNVLPLITLARAKQHERIDTDAEDSYLDMLIRAASSAVLNYLKDQGVESFTDSAGELIPDSNGDALDVPDVVQWATLLMFGHLYKIRDENTDDAFEMGYLPKPVMALLYPLRDPSLA